jgi:hypothetical protein
LYAKKDHSIRFKVKRHFSPKISAKITESSDHSIDPGYVIVDSEDCKGKTS